jgi:opacity protein-like surface antigen
MKRKTYMKTALILAASLGLALSASAQSSANTPATTPPTDISTANPNSGNYGLLGQDYAGVMFGYMHHIDGPPSVVHRYGFLANRPVAPTHSGVNVDALFKYAYTTGTDSGLHAWQHDMLIGGVGYLNSGGIRPFLEGDVGWAWSNNNLPGETKNDSFSYLIGGGAEFQIARQWVLTPFAHYQERPHFDTHVWSYGAQTSFRLAREWSTTFAAEIDEHHNIEYRVGWNRHF